MKKILNIKLTNPITYGEPASPNRWHISILNAEAIDLFAG
jgi:hypothetical protein